MSINWLVTAPVEGGLEVPTYGNYGGPSYSDGHVITEGETPTFTVEPVDALDALFRDHDIASVGAPPGTEAAGDIALLDGIAGLTDDALTPEGQLYAGVATLAILGRMVARGQADLLDPVDAFVWVRDAWDNLESGYPTPDAQEAAAYEAWEALYGGLAGRYDLLV